MITVSRLSHKATVLEARTWLEKVALEIGLGFHPDTDGYLYVDLDTGKRFLDDDSAKNLNQGLVVCFAVLEDPYAVVVSLFEPIVAAMFAKEA